MTDEHDRPEDRSPPPEEKAIDLSEDLRKGYVVMPENTGPETNIIDDMSDMPSAEPVSMEPSAGSEAPPESPPSDSSE